jgi:hypothetical protein
MRHITENPPANTPIHAARLAIWRLFKEGYVDEDMATAGLLAVDLGARRRSSTEHARSAARPAPRRASHSARRRPHAA